MNATRRSVLQAISMLAASSALASDSPALSSFIKPFDELPVKKKWGERIQADPGRHHPFW